MIRVEPRAAPAPALLRALAPVAAAVLALALAAVPLTLAGAPLGRAYAALFEGALGSRFALAETFARATPLILTGLAVAVAFRARLYNIGAEGQLYAGALAAAAVGSVAAGPPLFVVPAVLALAALAGGLVMLGPAALKTRFGVDEVVTTLLLNFIVVLAVSAALEGPLKDPLGMGWPQSPPVADAAVLPTLLPRMRVHAGLLLALAAAGLLALALARTVWGFEVRAVGGNPEAARFAGLPAGRVVAGVALLSGALAGLAGAGEVMGLKGYLTRDLSPGYGYAGVVVAMLAGQNPLSVVPAALFVAGVFVGADSMGRAVGVPSAIANLVVALALLCALLASLATRYRLRRTRGPGRAEAARG